MTDKIYLIAAKEIGTGRIDIFSSNHACKAGAPITYIGAMGRAYAHAVSVIETESGSDLHNWLKAAVGENVSIQVDI